MSALPDSARQRRLAHSLRATSWGGRRSGRACATGIRAFNKARDDSGLIAGEAGIGKTALVDAFVARIAPASAMRVGRGQCIEQYGAGEAYLPILEALGRLGRDPERIHRSGASGSRAELACASPVAGRQRAVPSAPVRPERMLRELTEAVERLTGSEPLILVLEDLHWSDRATLEWLAT